MARIYPQPRRKEELISIKMEKWIRGLNTLVSNTQIRPDELAEATNIQLVEDGKIQCPRTGQAYYGIDIGPVIRGLFPFYKSDGTKKLIVAAGQQLWSYTTTTATVISGYTYYENTSLSPSVSPSLSPSVSPSKSPSLSPSVSPSSSTSPSVSLSPSLSPSVSPSVSTSPSVSLSPSISPSLSPSVSLSPSLSPSVSPSVSVSPSASVSLSPSLSPSVSPSVSVSPSKSPSLSPSLSPSVSPSVSVSPSHMTTSELDTNGVVAYDRLYLCNGLDPLTYTDGSSITTFSGVAAMAAPTAVRTSGTTGTLPHYYKVTAVTPVGESAPSVSASAVTLETTLSTTAYITVTWTAGTSTDITGYNVYKAVGGVYYFQKYVEGQTATTYLDQGADTPSTVYTAPDADTTGGPVGKYIALYKDSLFIIGDPDNPSRLYYSGGGDAINNFSVSGGGGFIDISKNDGQLGTGLVVFKNTLIVFKEDSIYQFSFTTSGLPQVVQVNPAIGCIAPRSIVPVENDIFFMSRRGVFTLGNEQGFAFDVLRTNEISAKVRSLIQGIDGAYLDEVAGVYATVANVNLVVFAYTPSGSTANSSALIYDRERMGWYKWTNINANCFANYIDSSGNINVLYGASNSGYICELLTGTTDFGSSISGTFKLRAESFGALNRYKVLKRYDLIFRQPSGTTTCNIIADGVTTVKSLAITKVSPQVNWAHYTFTDFTFKDSQGTGATTASDDNILKTEKNPGLAEARSYQLQFTNGTNASFTLLLAALAAKPKSETYRQSTDILN